MRCPILKPIFLRAVMLLFFSIFVLAGCAKENGMRVPPEIEEDIKIPDGMVSFAEFATSLTLGETLEIPLSGKWNLKVFGFKKGDIITLTLRSDKNTGYKFVCEDFNDDGAVFNIPEDFRFIGGMCNVTAVSNGQSAEGDVFVSVVDNGTVEKKAGYTSYGRVIDCDGKPLKDVVVSDGLIVTRTDERGQYYLRSERKEGFVFISVPKNYKVAVNRTVPQFFKRFKTGKSTYEINNFILAPENNTASRVLVFTDTHLANRTDDIRQFEASFIPEIKERISEAASEKIPLYALALGDLAWDEYWYKNDYSLSDYIKTISVLDIPIYSCPGNHDNDPEISDDFLAAAGFRDNVGPTSYSTNIGDIHYIMMDNTLFHNKGGNVQDYEAGFTEDQFKWLEADLKTVPLSSTVVFGTHIQMTRRPDVKGNFIYNFPASFRTRLFSLLENYNVHFVTGHTHINYTNRISSTMVEHNIAAVCGTWWWTGYYSNGNCRINGDGSPSGYKVFDIKGNELSWFTKPVGRDESYQFRAYDLKNSQITRDLYCPDSKTAVTDEFFSKYANGWDKPENTISTNKILINVFDYAEGWKVEVFENGVERNVTRVDKYDPLHTVHFNMSRMNSGSKGSTSMTFPTGLTSHMFEASASDSTSSIVIKVTDSFGRVWQETMVRPRKLYDMQKEENKW